MTGIIIDGRGPAPKLSQEGVKQVIIEGESEGDGLEIRLKYNDGEFDFAYIQARFGKMSMHMNQIRAGLDGWPGVQHSNLYWCTHWNEELSDEEIETSLAALVPLLVEAAKHLPLDIIRPDNWSMARGRIREQTQKEVPGVEQLQGAERDVFSSLLNVLSIYRFGMHGKRQRDAEMAFARKDGKKLWDKLPTGTLVCSSWQILRISDERGKRTKRTLEQVVNTRGFNSDRKDITVEDRYYNSLLTGDRLEKILEDGAAEHLSAHEVIEITAAAKANAALAPMFDPIR